MKIPLISCLRRYRPVAICHLTYYLLLVITQAQVMLRSTIRRPVGPAVQPSCGAQDQVLVLELQCFLILGALPDEGTDLSFLVAAGPRQQSHSTVS